MPRGLVELGSGTSSERTYERGVRGAEPPAFPRRTRARVLVLEWAAPRRMGVDDDSGLCS
jgi:hypothetical protein